MAAASSTFCRKSGHSLIPDVQAPEFLFSEYINGNRKFDSYQVNFVRKAIVITVALTPEINDEISRMEDVLGILCRKREDLQKSEQFHRALIAPSRLLPLEILGQVFDQCVASGFEDDDWAQQPEYSRLDKNPLLLTSVCRYWRDTMLCTRRLWSSFSLSLRSKHRKTDLSLIGL